MVNITVFGPWSGKKTATAVDKAGLVNVGTGGMGAMGGMDSYDTEASLLPLANESRWNRRGKFCCLAFVADICAFLALLLIIFSTGFLLWKVWWVKTEVDKMQPAVMSLSASLSRLQADSDALQAENSALISAYSSQTGNGMNSDTPMEDINAQSLTDLANQDIFGERVDEEQSLPSGLLGMTIYVAVGKTGEDADTANLTEELKTLYDEASEAEGAGDESEDEDSILPIYPILDAGDNNLQTTNNPLASATSLPEDGSEMNEMNRILAALRDDDEEDGDEEDEDKPKRKSKDLADDDDGDSDDEEESVRTVKRVPFAEENGSDSD